MEFAQMTLKAEAPPFLRRFKLRREKSEHSKNLSKIFTEFYVHTRDHN